MCDPLRGPGSLTMSVAPVQGGQEAIESMVAGQASWDGPEASSSPGARGLVGSDGQDSGSIIDLFVSYIFSCLCQIAFYCLQHRQYGWTAFKVLMPLLKCHGYLS